MTNRERLLVNWVYYNPIGHAIEGFRVADGYRNAHPDMEIGVMINAAAGPELAECLPQIDHVYPVDVLEFTKPNGPYHGFEQVPQDWDYVFTDPRHDNPMGWDALDRCEREFRAYVRGRVLSKGYRIEGLSGKSRPLVLHLPDRAKEFATDFITVSAPVRISLLFGSGTEASRTPPTTFWRTLIEALSIEFPGVEIALLGAFKRGQGRSRTEGVTPEDIAGLEAAYPQVRDMFDKGLLNQLAICETCDLHISPHTGMSFAVQSVGVPWLCLTGGGTVETLFNGVPFISLFPTCERHPCHHPGYVTDPDRAKLPECVGRNKTNEPYLCQSEDALTARMGEIIEAAGRLIRSEISFHECLYQYQRKFQLRLGWKEDDWNFDGGRALLESDYIFRRQS